MKCSFYSRWLKWHVAWRPQRSLHSVLAERRGGSGANAELRGGVRGERSDGIVALRRRSPTSESSYVFSDRLWFWTRWACDVFRRAGWRRSRAAGKYRRGIRAQSSQMGSRGEALVEGGVVRGAEGYPGALTLKEWKGSQPKSQKGRWKARGESHRRDGRRRFLEGDMCSCGRP